MEEFKYVLDTYRLIKKDMDDGLTRDQLYYKYSEFRSGKPKTFFHILDGNFDEKMFLNIVKTYRETHNVATTDKETKASISVGEMLAERYLYPKVGRPDPEIQRKNQDDIIKN
jgi:hypothetical protein